MILPPHFQPHLVFQPENLQRFCQLRGDSQITVQSEPGSLDNLHKAGRCCYPRSWVNLHRGNNPLSLVQQCDGLTSVGPGILLTGVRYQVLALYLVICYLGGRFI